MNISFGTLKFPSPAVSSPAPALVRPGRLSAWGTTVWKALEAVGRARARRELLALANRWETGNPALAAQLRAAGSDRGNA